MKYKNVYWNNKTQILIFNFLSDSFEKFEINNFESTHFVPLNGVTISAHTFTAMRQYMLNKFCYSRKNILW